MLALGVLLLVSLGIAAGTVQSTVSDPGGGAPGAEAGGNPNGSGKSPAGEDALPSGPDEGERVDLLNNSGTRKGAGAAGEGASDGDGVVSVVTSPAGGLGLLILVGILAVRVAIRSAGRGVERAGDDDETHDEQSDAGTIADIGRVAGRAADHIDESDPDNAVYQAWLEMTRLLDVDDQRTTTPGEFATAAVDAGMARDDVERLTAAFEGVRYGGADPSAEREQEARAALRRIEAAYANGAGGTTDRTSMTHTEDSTDHTEER